MGNGGGGKSTLARHLADRNDLVNCSVDQIQWEPGWQAVPQGQVTSRIQEVIEGDRWVIDGWGPWPSIEARLARADTIIFVDLPLWMHFWLAAERQIEIARGGVRSDPVEGCADLDITRRLFETIWLVDQEFKPRLLELLAQYAPSRRYHHVTTLEQIAALGGQAISSGSSALPRRSGGTA